MGTDRAPSPPAPAPDRLPPADEVLGRMGSENFPVALRVLPRTLRDRLRAIYGYARFVDQLGDAYDGDRLGALEWVEGEVDRGLSGAAPVVDLHPLVAPAVALVRACGSGADELRALIQANRMDQTVGTYPDFAALVGYCHLSADPVGRLVLLAFDASTPERVAWSDRICTALQLAEHWQDLGEDVRAGRLYLPADDRARFGVGEEELRAVAERRGPAGPALRGLVAFETARARALLAEGEPLVRSLTGWARLAVAAFAAGGHAALDAVARTGYDPFAGAPAADRLATARHAAVLLRGRSAGARRPGAAA